jgi:hypothetical protein
MNDFLELERELKKLHPVQPSPELWGAVAKALENCRVGAPTALRMKWQSRKLSELPYNWLSLGFGLAAAAVFLVFARIEFQSPAKKTGTLALRAPTSVLRSRITSAEFVPAGVTQVVYNTQDEGLHFPAGSDQPVRWLRSQARETLQWRNPSTGASLRISYPSEEISLIPVSGE